METNEKEQLLNTLNEVYPLLYDRLEGLDLETVVFEDSGWRGRELLSHMAAWNREVASSLEHFVKGEEYLISEFDEDEFNQRTAAEHQELPAAEIVELWKRSTAEITAAVEKLDAESFPGDLLYPWGDEWGDITGLVKYFLEHDEEHIEEIENL
jgi:hypothetical protein